MRARRAIALVPLLAACGVIVGCSSGADPAVAVRAPAPLNCGMVVDPDTTGYFDGPLTAGRAIALLTALQRTRAARIAKGTLTGTDRDTLNAIAVELIGYSGNKLSDDAAAFAAVEQSYSPSFSSIDASYARLLQGDIAALERDCPSGPEPGVQRLDGGG